MDDSPAAPTTPAATGLPGPVLVVAAASAWALIGLLATVLLDAGTSPTEIGFWRAAIGAVAFGAQWRLGPRGAPTARPTRQDRWRVVAFGVVGVGVFYAALPAAVEHGGIGLATVLLYTAPAFVLAHGWWSARRAGERLGDGLGDGLGDRRAAMLVAAALVGVALTVAGSAFAFSIAAVVWGLVAGATYALWYVVGGPLATRLGVVAFSAASLAIGALVLAPAATLDHGADEWVVLAAIGLVSTWLPVQLYYRGLARMPAHRAALVANVEPVIAIALAVAVRGEPLTPMGAFGAVLVIGAAVAASRGPRPARPALS